MTSTPMPDLTAPQNVGYDVTDAAPIIHSIRWRHLPTRYTFTDVDDVITYHESGPLVINMVKHTASYLDVYLLRSITLKSVKVYLRFIRDTDGVLIEEPYTVGEDGLAIKVENDTANVDLQVIRGIVFTQIDLKDGTPMYDFPSMSNEGIYEVWVKAVTSTGEELHVRIPFEWEFNVQPPVEPPPVDPPPVTGEPQAGYDEYQVVIIEGGSPFTKRPTTHYRMAGVAMLEIPYCFTRVDTPAKPSIDKPAEVPVIGNAPTGPCAMQLSTDKTSLEVGDVVTLIPTHGNKTGIIDTTYDFDATAFKEVGEGQFEALKEGTHTIGMTVIYGNSQECTVAVTVTATQLPPPCNLKATATKTTMPVGDTFKIDLIHGNTTGVDNKGIAYDSTSIKFDAITEVYTATVGGTYLFTVVVTYKDGQTCSTTVMIEVTAPTTPPPGTLLCGQQAEGGTGFGEYKYQVQETGKYYIAYNFDGADDTMHLWIGGKKVYSSPTTTYDNGSPFSFDYKPADGELKVVMNDGSTGSYWTYTLYCPSNVPTEVKNSPKLQHVN